MLIKKTPTRLYFEGYGAKRKVLEQHLKYIDKKVDYEIRAFKNNFWFASKYGEEAYTEKLQELKDARNRSLLFEDETGLWTYSGLADILANLLDDQVRDDVIYPEPGLVPWDHVPEHAERYYQKLAKEKLIVAKHAAVEHGTGLGKSRVALELAKQLGLKTLVMAPSLSIAGQLFRDFQRAFGKKRVGKYYGGKKEAAKLFVIAVGASLTKVEEGSPDWIELSKTQVFIADESHVVACETLDHVCNGVCASAPYRFFFSGTQMRNDGLDLVLKGITGPIVHEMTVEEGVDQGFLAKPVFRAIYLDSGVKILNKDPDDPNFLTRKHGFYNPKVCALAGDMANKMVSLLGRPTLILVDEIEQFTYLLPYFRHEARFAHSGVTKNNRDNLPKEYWDSDPTKLVDQFNAGEFPILVGTSCIATGTDIKSVKACIYLRFGKSEIEVRQGVGRTTRLVPGKTDCFFVDFVVQDVPVLLRHAEARIGIYNEIYPSLTTSTAK